MPDDSMGFLGSAQHFNRVQSRTRHNEFQIYRSLRGCHAISTSCAVIDMRIQRKRKINSRRLHALDAVLPSGVCNRGTLSSIEVEASRDAELFGNFGVD